MFVGLWPVMLALALAAPAFSQASFDSAAAETEARVMAFDIPSQPLAAALKAYQTATSVQLFYETTVTDGRMSSAVRGIFSRKTALEMLLGGTGLAVASFEPGTMTVVPAPKPNSVDLGPAKARATAFTSYFALIQASLRSALCKAPAIRTDSSEIRVQLWIEPSGTVARAELLASSGSEVRDRDYLQALQSLAIGAPPPSMPQPVTMLILPRASQDAAQCVPIDASPPARRPPHE